MNYYGGMACFSPIRQTGQSITIEQIASSTHYTCFLADQVLGVLRLLQEIDVTPLRKKKLYHLGGNKNGLTTLRASRTLPVT